MTSDAAGYADDGDDEEEARPGDELLVDARPAPDVGHLAHEVVRAPEDVEEVVGEGEVLHVEDRHGPRHRLDGGLAEAPLVEVEAPRDLSEAPIVRVAPELPEHAAEDEEVLDPAEEGQDKLPTTITPRRPSRESPRAALRAPKACV